MVGGMYDTHQRTCLKSRVLLCNLVLSVYMYIQCTCTRTTVEDHGCTGKGRQVTYVHVREQLPSSLLDLCLYYCCTVHQSFGCSSFFVYRSSAVQELFDRHVGARHDVTCETI